VHAYIYGFLVIKIRALFPDPQRSDDSVDSLLYLLLLFVLHRIYYIGVISSKSILLIVPFNYYNIFPLPHY
jgi:hypothetical protein